jgi:hypothetical protein
MGDPARTDYMLELEGEEAEKAEPESFGQLVRQRNLDRVERHVRILKLRRDGLTYDQISQALARGDDGKPPFEITPSGIKSVVGGYVRELTETAREATEELRLIDNERLERMFSRLEIEYHKTKDSKIRGQLIAQQLKVMERHAKLNGLDAPQLHEHSGSVNVNAIADRAHVEKVDREFRDRFGKADFELPAGDVADLPDEDASVAA